jgi:hypothetical protein
MGEGEVPEKKTRPPGQVKWSGWVGSHTPGMVRSA